MSDKYIKIVITLAAFIFLISTSWLYLTHAPVFNSPDEAASFAVIESFARRDGLWLTAIHADTQATSNLVHPRSMVVVGERLVPAGFFGLPLLYGVIARIAPFRFLHVAVGVLTPLFALLGLCALYGIVRRIFQDKRLALVSVFLLGLHPAFWYYTARGLFHNVLFVSLLLISAWLFLRHRHRVIEDVGAMLSFSLALLVRPSELWWVLALAGALIFWNRREMRVRRALTLALSAVVFTIGTFLLYRYVYGLSPLGVINTAYANSTEGFVANAWWRFFLPFGFHPRVIWWSVAHWYDLFLLPYAALTLLGIVLLLRSKERDFKRWLYAYLCVTAWLFVVYGSWLIFDNPSRDVTIGGAYLRYWLPSFVLAAPIAGNALLFCMQKLSKKVFIVASIAVVIGLGAFLAYRAGLKADGVRDVGEAMDFGAELKRALKTHDLGIADNSIIVTDKEDKYLTGEWQVITPVKNKDNLQAAYDLLNEGKPVYFVTHLRTIDEWRDLKDNWFNPARLMYVYWFSVGDHEVHALKRIPKE